MSTYRLSGMIEGVFICTVAIAIVATKKRLTTAYSRLQRQ